MRFYSFPVRVDCYPPERRPVQEQMEAAVKQAALGRCREFRS
jgi:hypothetical protein